MACTFSTSQLPKMLRAWCALYVFTSQRASYHNGVHFFNVPTSKSALRATTACNCSSLISPDGSAPVTLASLLFDPPEPQIIGKTRCFATLLPFRAPASSSLLWSSFFFSSLLFSDSSHLCFFICPYCRKIIYNILYIFYIRLYYIIYIYYVLFTCNSISTYMLCKSHRVWLLSDVFGLVLVRLTALNDNFFVSACRVPMKTDDKVAVRHGHDFTLVAASISEAFTKHSQDVQLSSAHHLPSVGFPR